MTVRLALNLVPRSPTAKGKGDLRYEISCNLRSGVIFILLSCFFGSRGKKITKTDYRDKGRGHDRRLD